MKWSQMTDVGRVRATNEDSLCACPEIGLFAVADGMGGHQAGEVASITALNYFQEILKENLHQWNDVAEGLLRSLTEVNLRVYRLALENEAYKGMGTTLTAGLFFDHEMIVAHIGDSRAYLIRNQVMEQITDDHSLVGEMLRRGGITRDQAQNHPQRNILTRALGTAPLAEFDLYRVKLLPGDLILFCTDGLSNHLTPDEIKDFIVGQRDLDQALNRLMQEALGRGGLDNISMVLVRVDD